MIERGSYTQGSYTQVSGGPSYSRSPADDLCYITCNKQNKRNGKHSRQSAKIRNLARQNKKGGGGGGEAGGSPCYDALAI